MNHYFLGDNVEFAPQLIEFVLLGERYQIYSAAGLFSANKADYGSLLLATTALDFARENDRVLDLGCGNGLVGLIVALRRGVNVDFLDINPNAVEATRMNIKKFAIPGEAFVSDGLTNVKSCYDLILFNPPIRAGKAVYYPIFHEARKFLTNKGVMLVVIRKDLGGPSAIKELEKSYLVELVERKRGYYLLKATPREERICQK